MININNAVEAINWENINISDEDMRWLYYGDDIEHIISRLTNNEDDRLKILIDRIKDTHVIRDDNIGNILHMIHININMDCKPNTDNKVQELIMKNISPDQIKRLDELITKSGIEEANNQHNLELKKIHDSKIYIVNKALSKLNLTINDIAKSSNTRGNFIRMYYSILSEYGYSSNIDDLNDIVKELTTK